MRRVTLGFTLCLLLSPPALGQEVIRDRELIALVLQTGTLDLSPGVAQELPQERSQLRIRRIGLSQGEHRIRAAFRDKSRRVPASRKVNVRYLDAYYNEVAAYLVARELGLEFVPLTVLREIGINETSLEYSKTLRQGSLQLWIENAVAEYDIGEDGPRYPGDLALKYEQLSEIHVFDCIIGNVDRHAGNILIDLNARYPGEMRGAAVSPLFGKLWAIDHSRAFHGSARVSSESCKLHRLASRPVSLIFLQGMREWNVERTIRALRQAGLSNKQIDSLHLEVLGRRLGKVLSRLEQMRSDSGLNEAEFFSSGIWHRVY
jgi:hypothetical protein